MAYGNDRRDNRRGREESSEYIEKLVSLNRVSKTVKGGRIMKFSALMVVGDGKGKVGFGMGKAGEVSEAIRKGTDAAKRHLVTVTMKGKSIPHTVTGQCDGGRVLLMPASEGTGVIAGGGMRAVLEMAGYQDILGKSQGSKNRLNVVKATFDALSKLRTEEQIRAERANA